MRNAGRRALLPVMPLALVLAVVSGCASTSATTPTYETRSKPSMPAGSRSRVFTPTEVAAIPDESPLPADRLPSRKSPIGTSRRTATKTITSGRESLDDFDATEWEDEHFLPTAASSRDRNIRQVAQRVVTTDPNADTPHEPSGLLRRLEIPKELPGADAPPLKVPRKRDTGLQEHDRVIDELFPAFATPDSISVPEHQPELQLEEVEQIALDNSPIIAQYQADITSAVGSAIQAGTHPNPIVGYEADTVGSSSTRDYQGVYASQIIKTAGKLKLSQSIENVDLMNSQLALQKARVDLQSRVRAQFFAVLVAQESLKITQAMVRLTHEVYRVQVQQLKADQSAGYEPMQLRALVVQSRAAYVQARNRYVSAWKQLSATLNQPQMAPTQLVGNVSSPIPLIDYEEALGYILENHTDIRIARNGKLRALLTLELAEKSPIPDVFVYATFQRDFTTPNLPRTSYNAQVGVPLPIFDQNRGNILAARGSLVRASQEITKVSNDLRATLSDAYERYENNRVTVEYYRSSLLPDQARTYRGVYSRHQVEPDVVGFSDVVVAQQNLINSVTTYITSLAAQWTAVTDVASVMQLNSLREMSLRIARANGDEGIEPLADDEETPSRPAPAIESMATVIKRILFEESAVGRQDPASAHGDGDTLDEVPAAIRPTHYETTTSDAGKKEPLRSRPAPPQALDLRGDEFSTKRPKLGKAPPRNHAQRLQP